jgi:hypothetical protein
VVLDGDGGGGGKGVGRVVAPKEYSRPIKDAWQRVHRLADGTDPLTKSEYALLQKTINQLYREGVPLADVLGTIDEIGQLAQFSPVWAGAKPPVLLKHISSYRGDVFKRQIELYKARRPTQQEVECEYNPEHDWRRR